MSTNQAEAARNRWSGLTREERAAANRHATAAMAERRRLAFDVLRALEAAGLKIEPADRGASK